MRGTNATEEVQGQVDSNLAAGLAMIGAIGPGIGLGIGFSKAMEALGATRRRPARSSCRTSWGWR